MIIDLSSSNYSISIIDKTDQWMKSASGGVSVIFNGHFYIDNILYQGESASNFIIDNINSSGVASIDNLLLMMNGSWACILIVKDLIYICSDIIRSIPLFYSITDNTIHVSNRSRILVNSLGLAQKSRKNMYYYARFAHAKPGETVYENLYDVKAGSYIAFKYSLLKKEYRIFPEPKELTYSDALQASASVFDRVFNRLKLYIELNPAATILLPLSGGMDSRLLAWFLKKYKIKNKIVAFTYGVDEESEEAIISRKVADFLNIEHRFIQYTAETWLKVRAIAENESVAFNIEKACMHFQDFYAIKVLRKEFDNTLVLPGLCFDMLAGLTLRPSSLACFHLSSKLPFIVSNNVQRGEIEFLEGKVSSYVVNSVRTYEYYGMKYVLPYWDVELYQFWFSLPYAYRYSRNLFRSYLNQYAYVGEFSGLFSIPIAKNRPQDSLFRELSAIERMKSIIKLFLKKIYFDKLYKILWAKRMP